MRARAALADDATPMKIHEYQGKELFRKYGVATPRGLPCASDTEVCMPRSGHSYTGRESVE